MREPFVMNPHLREAGKVRQSLPRRIEQMTLGQAESLARLKFYLAHVRRNAEIGLAAIEAVLADIDAAILCPSLLGEIGHHLEEVIAGCQRAINPPEEEDDEEPEEPTVVYEEPKESAN